MVASTRTQAGGDVLNLAEMHPSLAYMDARTGDILLELVELAPELRQLSIRHLAVGAA